MRHKSLYVGVVLSLFTVQQAHAIGWGGFLIGGLLNPVDLLGSSSEGDRSAAQKKEKPKVPDAPYNLRSFLEEGSWKWDESPEGSYIRPTTGLAVRGWKFDYFRPKERMYTAPEDRDNEPAIVVMDPDRRWQAKYVAAIVTDDHMWIDGSRSFGPFLNLRTAIGPTLKALYEHTTLKPEHALVILLRSRLFFGSHQLGSSHSHSFLKREIIKPALQHSEFDANALTGLVEGLSVSDPETVALLRLVGDSLEELENVETVSEDTRMMLEDIAVSPERAKARVLVLLRRYGCALKLAPSEFRLTAPVL